MTRKLLLHKTMVCSNEEYMHTEDYVTRYVVINAHKYQLILSILSYKKIEKRIKVDLMIHLNLQTTSTRKYFEEC